MNMDPIRNHLAKYPELFLYLLKDIDLASDLMLSESSEQTQQIYHTAAETFEQIRTHLSEPLKSLLFKIDFSERSILFEKVLNNLLVLEMFLKNEPLPSLIQEQFYYLQDLIKNYFPKTSLKLLEIALVMGDIGKVRAVRYMFAKDFHIDGCDPELFLTDMFTINHTVLGQVFPSLKQFSLDEFSNFVQIKTEFNLKQFIHASATAKELILVKEQIEKHHIDVVYQNFVVHLLSAADLNQTIFKIYVNCLLPALDLLHHTDVEHAYAHYLAERAKIAGFSFQHITYLNWSEFFSLRLLCLLGITENKQAKRLFDALDTLWMKAKFKEGCEFVLTYQLANKTPTYMPCLFSNLIRVFSKENNPYEHAIYEGIRLIKLGLELHISLMHARAASPFHPVNFNGLAQVILNKPQLLNDIRDKQTLVIRRSDYYVLPASLNEVVINPRGYLFL